MRLIKIQKRPGAYRVVCAPDEERKTALRSMVGALEAKARTACPEAVLHGFTTGKSPVTNAKAHLGYQFSLCFDLQDFFDTVGPRQLNGKLTNEEKAAVLYDPGDGRGLRAMQGLPTSPAVANIAAGDMDRAILEAIRKSGYAIQYTRYADDLTFSFNAAVSRGWLMESLPPIVGRCGFKLNKAKTHFQLARAGNRVITGVAVGEEKLLPTRDVRRRLRAARHQAELGVKGAKSSARGLEEWAKLKMPRKRDPLLARAAWRATLDALIPFWGLGNWPVHIPPVTHVPELIDGDYIITHDPAYMLGMSTYTTGWVSCMRQPAGQYRHGAQAWFSTAGTSIAGLLSPTQQTYGGISRRVLRARCLVHSFENGMFGYDRIYGDLVSTQELTSWLRARGYRPVNGAVGAPQFPADRVPPRTVVRGVPPRDIASLLYFDSLTIGPCDAAGNQRVMTY